MGKVLSTLCHCFGREEKPKLSTNEYVKKQYDFDGLHQDELQTPLRFYVMNKRHYHCI